ALDRESKLRTKLDSIRAAVDAVEPAKATEINGEPVKELEIPSENATRVPKLNRPQKLQPDQSEVPSGLTKCDRFLLTALAQHGTLTLEQAAIVAGYAPNSGGVRNSAGHLRALGYVEGSNTTGLTATKQGSQALGWVESLPTGPALARYWMGKLSKAEREILAQVIAHHPRDVSLQRAAEKAGYAPTSGGVRNAAGRLRTLCLVTGSNAAMAAAERLIRCEQGHLSLKPGQQSSGHVASVESGPFFLAGETAGVLAAAWTA